MRELLIFIGGVVVGAVAAMILEDSHSELSEDGDEDGNEKEDEEV